MIITMFGSIAEKSGGIKENCKLSFVKKGKPVLLDVHRPTI